MQFSLEQRTAALSVGEFSDFTVGPHDSGGGPQGLWRAQLGQHWHNELRGRAQAGDAGARFEVPVEGRLVHRGWAFTLTGRIDQLAGGTLREIKTVTRPLPADESALRADYPAYFLQLAAYVVLLRTYPDALGASGGPAGPAASRHAPPTPPHPRPRLLPAELVFVETGTGLCQTIALTPFDEALVFHQLDALVEFLQTQVRAAGRRHSLVFRSPFAQLRPGQETIQQDLATAFDPPSSVLRPQSPVLLLEAPTGYGKTGCVLEFALGRLKTGQFDRLIWLTGKSTGQIHVVHTLRQMTAPAACSPLNDKDPVPPVQPVNPTCNIMRYKESGATAAGPAAVGGSLAVWQVRNKREHCVNDVFHCVRDACGFLAGCAERWPASGLVRFCTGEEPAHDLATLKAAGRSAHLCPYEITRAALAAQDVWIGDYNYVFAPDNRGLFYDQPGFDPARTLLVIDEAHNLPSRVADAYSHTAHEAEARGLLAELDHQRAPAALVLAAEEWARLLASLHPCEALDPAAEADLHELLGRLAELVTATPLDYAALGPQHSETLWELPALHDFLADTTLRRLLWVPRAGELAFTCIDATEAIGATLRQYGGALLMSATLTPFARTAEACGLGEGLEVGRAVPCPPLPGAEGTPRPTAYTTLRAPAPWRDGAYDVAVDLRVDTSYHQRGNHYNTTAETIVALQAAAAKAAESRESKDESKPVQQPSTFDLRPSTSAQAVAIFFPSYAYAERVRQALEHGGSVLRVALQPRQSDLAAQTAWVEENLALADVLFLVLGSSFAEGIDLLGGRVTHAMVVGPALPEVNALQKARLDTFAALGRDAAFRRVYQIPGLQKVNQALGRLVRAPGQRAKVLLHCRRFAETSYATLLAHEYQFYREITEDGDLQAWLGN